MEMEAQDYPIRHFETMTAFSIVLRAIPAQIQEATYSYESFGSWWVTIRCKGITVLLVYDGKEDELRLERSNNRKPPHEWREPHWRKGLYGRAFDSVMQAEVADELRRL